ncbi:hypothetical protein L6452_33717 [Arctium lappa]|uniref:Uncharacterized protein n=1 Tax=Arctium lappa TaxID=4217 RepID=A0ACB8YGC9_ARCLA|nr:hypothetical protein L6452_33717 [Arctium lappa]
MKEARIAALSIVCKKKVMWELDQGEETRAGGGNARRLTTCMVAIGFTFLQDTCLEWFGSFRTESGLGLDLGVQNQDLGLEWWAQIATKLPGRSDNEIKNFWNSCLKKKLIKQGIDPNTHKPIITAPKEVNENMITSFACKQKNSQSSSLSSSSMATATHELDQAFHMNNNGGLTNNLFLGELEMGMDPIDLHCNLLAQYQQMNCETSSSSFDLSDNSTSRMIMDSFVKEEEGNANQWQELQAVRANYNNAGDFMTLGREAQLAKGWSDFAHNNARDFSIYQMGILSETLLGEYLDFFAN